MTRQPATATAKSQIMKAAWAKFRSPLYKGSFGEWLRWAWEAFRTQSGIFAPAVVAPTYSDRQAAARHIEAVAANFYQKHDLRNLMQNVMAEGGFAAEVAETVYKSGRVSPKQAWVLAGSVYFSGFSS